MTSEGETHLIEYVVRGDIAEAKRWLKRNGKPKEGDETQSRFIGSNQGRLLELAGDRWKTEGVPLFSYHTSATALHVACALGHDALAVSLVTEFKFDPAAEALGCGCALHMASLAGSEPLVSWLLTFDACRKMINQPVNSYTSAYPLQFAACRGHTAIAKKLLEAGADPNVPILTGGGASIAAQVLDPAGIWEEFPPLEKRLEMVEFLLDHGATATPDLLERVAAVEPGKGALTAKVLARLPPDGPKVNLIKAVRTGNLHLVTMLLEAGHDPNATDGNWTALHHACRDTGGTKEMTELLLKHGANPLATTRGGLRPSQVAGLSLKNLLLEAEAKFSPTAKPEAPFPFASQVQQLAAMGFVDEEKAKKALMASKGDIEGAVNILLASL